MQYSSSRLGVVALLLACSALQGQNDFVDDFNRPDGPVDGWRVYNGSWDISDGRLRTAVQEGWIWAGDPPIVVEGDFELSLDVTFPSVPGDTVGRHGGIMLFAGSATERTGNTGYELDWIDRASDHGFRLLRYDANPVTLVNGTPQVAEPPTHWVISIVGDRITVTGDGNVVIDILDGTYRQGLFGVWSYSNSEMLVDNIDLRSGASGLRSCFQADPRTGEAPLEVSFDASCSAGSDEEGIVGYAWDFGDGTTGSGSSVSHTFQEADAYVVRLTVTGDAGGTAISSRVIDVFEPGVPPPLDVDRLLNDRVKRFGASGDSTVVFNELMYHPASSEETLEWLELYNQMAVNVDVSNWLILGGVSFEIPADTVIPGGGFLVIARNPQALESATGFDGALGPFFGRLGNDGDRLQLYNRAGREMDGMRYNDGGGWPAAPDGSGVSLAKLDPLSSSEPADNWAPSRRIGGTPGAPNFPAEETPAELPTVSLNEFEFADVDDYTVELVNYGDTAAQLEGLVIAPGNLVEHRLGSRLLEPNGFLTLSRNDLGFDLGVDAKLFLYSSDRQMVLDAVKVSLGNRGRHPDGRGPWVVPDAPSFGGPNGLTLEESIVINEIHYHPRLKPAQPDVYSETTLVALDAVWRYIDTGQDLGTNWRQSGYNDSAWSSGDAVFFNETADLPGPKNTEIDLGAVTYYFRTSFDVSSPVAGELQLRLLVDDGAVVYLNGAELLRENMPEGAITASTLAVTGVGDATITGPYSVPSGSLRVGTNVLAVEVHQGSATSSDVVFAAELFASVLVEAGHSSREPPESWIELYNRGDHVVDLTGWEVDRGIDYAFEPGTVLGPGEYLVVAEDKEALGLLHPGVRIVGNFTDRLSNRTDLLVLRDDRGNPVDSVEYFEAGRWSEWADGGGSSLELRDPFADNSKGEAWDASDEAIRTTWRTYSYREVAVANVGPTQWREFVIGLLSAGEILIDDLSVVQSPASAPRQLLQNGDFESGEDAWRILGNHRHSAVIDDPDSPGNKVLYIVATGPTEHMHNHLETTLVNNAAAPDGVEYEVSFRARWLRGSNQLHTRLYFNRVPRTTLIDVPDGAGTPGAENSVLEENIAPTFDRLRHTPVVPNAGDPVLVSVFAEDPDGVAGVKLWWSVAGGVWQSTSMSPEPEVPSLYSALIPGQSSSAIVQLYVEAEDALGAVGTYPARGRDSRALYKVQDGQSRDGPIHNFRIIMTTADANFLHAETNVMSNERLGATVVYREEEVFYDVGCRLKGSQRGRLGGSRVSFSVQFQPDALFRGAHRTVSLDRSGGWGIGAGPTGQDEIIVKHAVNRAGLPGMYDDIGWLVAPRSAQNGPTLVMMSKYSSAFLRTQYPEDSDGSMYKVELIYYPTTTVDGDPESLKRPQPDTVLGTDLRDLGDDKEPYRWNFLLENNEERDDYDRLIQLCKVMGSSGATFAGGIENLLDVDEATRMYVIHTLCGISDTYWFAANFHNIMLYELPLDGRFVILSWDDDWAFGRATNAPLWGGPNLAKLYGIPEYERLFYGHLKDITDDFFNASHMRRWTDHYGELAQETGSFNTVLSYIDARSRYVRSVLPAQVPFAITTNGGNDFDSDESTVTLQGTGWIDIRAIVIPGLEESPEVSWSTRDRWSLTVPLYQGRNNLRLSAYDYKGNVVGFDSITVTSTAGPDVPRFTRGDSNADGTVDISDAVTALVFLFLGGSEPSCHKTADIDDNGILEITDAVYLLDYLFRSGEEPPGPYPFCGVDPTPDDLTCESFEPCDAP